MTPEEAIEFYKTFLSIRPANPYQDAAKLSIQALEKQIPKKPKTDQYGYYVCPSCGADDYALMHDSNLANQYNHCHDCGQALDWSDVV